MRLNTWHFLPVSSMNALAGSMIGDTIKPAVTLPITFFAFALKIPTDRQVGCVLPKPIGYINVCGTY